MDGVTEATLGCLVQTQMLRDLRILFMVSEFPKYPLLSIMDI